MNIRLDNKHALVTGSNSGIGEAIALALAAAGAKVAVNYVVNADAADEVVRTIEAAGGEALAVQADVSKPDEVDAMFKQLDDAWGRLDILVNNAGVDGQRMLSWEADLSAWRKVLEVNMFGAFYCASAALKRMTGQRAGVILNMTSVHEIIAWSGYSAYTASKAGLSMLTKTLAQEAAPYGVRVVSLAPGAIKTDINKSVWSDPVMLEDLQNKIPLHRMGTPEDIANMALVLVSDVAGYVTGSSLFVDGAMTDYPDFAQGG